MAKNKAFPKLKHFKPSEFDCPELPGSHRYMNHDFLLLLDKARSLAKIPFIINSGYRTAKRNKNVGGSSDSSHLKGLAVDIACVNSLVRMKLVYCLLMVGFTRIGIGKDFIHVDLDSAKQQNLIWHYYK